MKSFDLTFSGTVLPEHDPSLVKSAFGKLFCIDDTAELDEIFSGKTVVLRHNLDRKTAAEYFSRITEMGGRAALVESSDPPTDNGESSNNIQRHTRSTSRTAHEYSSERDKKDRPEQPLNYTTEQLLLEEETQLRRILSENTDELSRLRALVSQMKEDSRLRYSGLQCQKEEFQRIADQELARLAEASNTTLAETQNQMTSLREEEERKKQFASATIAKMEQQQLERKRLAEHEVVRLETLKKQSEESKLALITEIEARREMTRLAAETEIRRLQQLLLETQRQAEIDDAHLEHKLENAKSKYLDNIALLDQQIEETFTLLERDINSIERRQEEAKLQLEADTAKQRLHHEMLQRDRRAELARLHELQLGIKKRRDTGIAEVEHASTQLDLKTREALKKLYAMELQAKRRQNDALENCQKRGFLEAGCPKITSN